MQKGFRCVNCAVSLCPCFCNHIPNKKKIELYLCKASKLRVQSFHFRCCPRLAGASNSATRLIRFVCLSASAELSFSFKNPQRRILAPSTERQAMYTLGENGKPRQLVEVPKYNTLANSITRKVLFVGSKEGKKRAKLHPMAPAKLTLN